MFNVLINHTLSLFIPAWSSFRFSTKEAKGYHIMVPDLVGLNPAVDWVYYFFYEKIHMRSLPPPTGQKYSFLYTFQVRSSI